MDSFDPPSRAWMPRVAIYTTFPLAIVFIILRIYTRLWFKRGLGWDDYTCLASGFASAGFCCTLLAQVLDDTYGRHLQDVPLSAITGRFMQETCAILSAYFFAAALIKISLLTLYRRLFSPSPRANIIIWVALVFTTLCYCVCLALWIIYSALHRGDGGWTGAAFILRIFQQAPTVGVTTGTISSLWRLMLIGTPVEEIRPRSA
ncbi:hypothetical protein F5Y13DRAFT_169124 [Hypoxylon sp. FL1857]|nr:hypothetical protein F5Y13DRAFT_169124 [Hypoxylon sp. FL1857]